MVQLQVPLQLPCFDFTPVLSLTFCNAGLTANIIKEIELNLSAHELIKVQVAGDDRDARKALYLEITEKTNSLAVHHIGKQLVFYRASETIKEKVKIHIPKL